MGRDFSFHTSFATQCSDSAKSVVELTGTKLEEEKHSFLLALGFVSGGGHLILEVNLQSPFFHPFPEVTATSLATSDNTTWKSDVLFFKGNIRCDTLGLIKSTICR